jgi:UDP-sulfoquinovose synthase
VRSFILLKKSNIIIAGGDGFCGWPLALRLSKKNYNVIIIDNFKRRKIDKELKTNSITPIKSLKKRIFYWEKNFWKKN